MKPSTVIELTGVAMALAGLYLAIGLGPTLIIAGIACLLVYDFTKETT
jgi:hypothetical protein